MNNFNFITPSDFMAKHATEDMTEAELQEQLADLRERASAPDQECENCSAPAWKYGSLGLCFSCHTGESDASDDYELIPEATP